MTASSKPPFAGERVPFASVFRDVTRSVGRIRNGDYLRSGRFPIVDQGQEQVAGYSNGEEGLCEDVPAIVFGDHTRCVKHVDFPFFAGADGVKILKPILGDARYWYHALKSVRLENLGYSRHFKLLKQTSFIWVDEGDQHRIARVLDAVLALEEVARRQLSLLDNLVKSRFVEMFESRHWGLCRAREFFTSVRNGVSPSKNGLYPAKVLTLSAITRGHFDCEEWKEGLFSAEPPQEKRVRESEFYICRGNGNRSLVGAGEFSNTSRPDLVFPDTVIAARLDDEKVCGEYLRYAWRLPSVRRQLETRARTTNGTYKINQQVVLTTEIPLPPLSLQREFSAFADRVAKSQVVVLRPVRELMSLSEILRVATAASCITGGVGLRCLFRGGCP